jgi:hypothetical protein
LRFCKIKFEQEIKQRLRTGTNAVIFEIVTTKKSAKKMAFLTQNKAKLCKNLIITLVFEKNVNMSPKIGKNRRKL